MLRLLRRRYPGAQIDFWGSEATADFERALCGNEQPLNWRISWDKPNSKLEEKSRIESIANAATKDMRRLVLDGNQLRCFNSLTQPDQLAPTDLGGRRQSAR